MITSSFKSYEKGGSSDDSKSMVERARRQERVWRGKVVESIGSSIFSHSLAIGDERERLVGRQSPAHKASSKLDELVPGQRLSEDVRNLVLGRNVFDCNRASDNVGPKVMQSNRQVFSTRACLVVGRDLDTTAIVFKSAADDLRSLRGKVEASSL